MTQRMFRPGRLVLAIFLLSGMVAVTPVWSRDPQHAALDSVRQEQLWRLGSGQVAVGRFDDAADTFEKLAEQSRNGESAGQVAKWLDSFGEIDARRHRIRQKQYDENVEIAKDRVEMMRLRPYWVAVFEKPMEWMGKWSNGEIRESMTPAGQETYDRIAAAATVVRETWGLGDELDAARTYALKDWYRFRRFHLVMFHLDWTDVLATARYAMLNAADEDAFRQEPWLDTLVAESIAAAEEFREKHEWLDASGIYYELTEIFPDDRGMEEALEECNGHARIDMLYSPDGEWKDDVQRIYVDMLRSILEKVEREYTNEPNFRDIARSGLKSLLLLADSETLKESYNELKDEFLVEHFKIRINKLLRDVAQANVYTKQHCQRDFETALAINKQTLILDNGLVIAELAHGALSELDEFSSVIWPSEVEDFRKHTVGEFSGVGISINMLRSGEIQVFSPLEGTPAYEAGIQPGDIISSIDGETTEGFTSDDAVERITGPSGTTVTLGITRQGVQGEIEVPLVRSKITIQTVKSQKRDASGHWDFMIDPERKIGYIRVSNFMENTTRELRAALSELEARGAEGVILDLRFNPGGLMKSAVEMSELFLDPGKVVVSTKGRTEASADPVRANPEGRNFTDLPLVVLVNDYSASASEIVSGAIRDHKRGLVVGERTFGKGSVQNLIPIGDRAATRDAAFLKLTTASYYLPGGRCIHREKDAETWGVDPDVAVKMYPREAGYVLEARRKADVLRGKNQSGDKQAEDEVVNELLARDGEEQVDADIQLEAALLALRVRLLGHTDWSDLEAAVAINDAQREPQTEKATTTK